MTLEASYAAYRPSGEFDFDTTVKLIDDALAYCRDNGIACLLADITSVTGFPPPSMAQRFQFATQWSATAAGRVALAMIAPPDMIDKDRIGVTMLNNRGMRSEVFTSEPDAMHWLGTVCAQDK